MRAATRERMIRIVASVLVISICFLAPKAAAQSDKYSKMATVDQYLMERNAEILLARSAAPDSISSGATILVLGRHGKLAYCRLSQLPSRWAFLQLGCALISLRFLG